MSEEMYIDGILAQDYGTPYSISFYSKNYNLNPGETINMSEEEISKADKMFEELGYITEERENVIIYNRINCKQSFRRKNIIYFDKNRKELKIGERTETICRARKLSMQELQAINEKVKELGWDE